MPALDPAPKTEIAEIADLRRTLIANGYSPIPVRTNEKRPTLRGWSKLRPNPDHVDGLLRTHRDHLSTGLLTGDLVAIDIDVMDEACSRELQSLVADQPNAAHALCRVGQAPKILFLFRSEAPREKAVTRKFTIGGKPSQVEVMGRGQQIVAFGIHPETGRDYEWIGDSPLDVPFADLPLLSGAAIDALIADAETILSRHGSPTVEQKRSTTRPTTGGTFWQQVNSAALANIGAWASALFSTAKEEQGTGAWRVHSADLGRGLEEDISIHPDGIRDFGEEEPSTPISLVQKWGGAASPKDAAFWLCEKIGRDPVDFGWETAKPSASFTKSIASLVAANDNDDTPERPSRTPRPTGLPVELCYPPGAVGEFTRFIESCSRFPSPHLSLAASLALTAGLIGRRYKGPTGLRSNLYVVGLAESGFGKDVTIRATAAMADATSAGDRVSKAIFMDEVRSVPGLAAALRKSPSAVTVIDEFGKWLGLHTGRKASPHREEIATNIMALTGAPAGYWGGQEKGAGNIPRIIQPCFSIHGVSTPSTFWNALSSGNIAEGLLGRIVLIDAGNAEPKKVRKPRGSLEEVPESIGDRVHALLGGGGGRFEGGSWYALNAKSDEKPWPVVTVEYAPGVEDQFEDFDDDMRARKKDVPPEYRPIVNRVGENAARLALIVAVGCDPKHPIITPEIQGWANSVALASFETMIRGADDNIADNEKSAEYLRVRGLIERREDEGMTMKNLSKSLRGGIDSRRLDDIIGQLRVAHDVHLASRKSQSGQTMRRLWGADFLPEDAEIIPPGE